jgi:hypothetical protein
VRLQALAACSPPRHACGGWLRRVRHAAASFTTDRSGLSLDGFVADILRSDGEARSGLFAGIGQGRFAADLGWTADDHSGHSSGVNAPPDGIGTGIDAGIDLPIRSMMRARSARSASSRAAAKVCRRNS